MLATRVESGLPVAGPGERALRDTRRGFRRRGFRVWPFLGPAFIACVAYIDPGNFATNIAAGSKFGYTLAWVIVASNLMAMLIQTLSAKLGIATGRNLPEVCRERFSRPVTLLDRPYRRLVDDLPVRYVGFTVPDELFVGYGFDLQERHRNLPDLHVLRRES